MDDLLPNRFKVCVGGCPNSCMKPSLNDFGIEGHIVPEYDEDKCRGCRVCQIKRHCPSDAISFIDGKVHVESDKCRTCGICRNKCPFHVFHEDARTKYQIYLGGTWGRNSRIADSYPRLVEREEIFPLLDRTLEWYKANAAGHERFGMTLERLGFQTYLRDVSPDDGGTSCILNMTRNRPTI
ncbi:MAG: 4Fe-4S dicluster domain-containing protein [Eubacteriales bacterium]|jgi:dissimilatory sulfite reductase (desulfoviridin) alpha/beta subunit